MQEIRLNEEDFITMDLRYRINGLSTIAALIPKRYFLIRANPLNKMTLRKPIPIKGIFAKDFGKFFDADFCGDSVDANGESQFCFLLV